MKTVFFLLIAAATAAAQQAPAAAREDAPADPAIAAAQQAPAAISNPPVTGPLQLAAPHMIDIGPFGKIAANGALSGFGLIQSNPLPGDKSAQAALSNGQIFVQKTDGWLQFFVEAGGYTIPDLGTPFLSAEDTVNAFYGFVPVAYLRLAPFKTTSILVGALPTLLGAESTFSFQNMNIQRGLLWNQENAVNRGIQVNQSIGKFTASLSWNDGYYSNRFSWLSGSLSYANGPHAVTFSGMGNLGQTAFQSLATPVQNNGTMYALVYTYSKDNWIVQPYTQFGDVPTNPKAGVVNGARTRGGALLLTRKFSSRLAVAGRAEYLSTTGSASGESVNLLYGPGSGGWSATVTPTYQAGAFFLRGEFAIVGGTSYTPGSGFGPAGMDRNQARGALEVGFLF
jgi:hypothetical protein